MIARGSLGRLHKLGAGGSGDVFEIIGTGTVYKEFNAASRRTDVVLWARGSVSFWQGLSATDQAELAAMAVWPTDLVEHHGDVVGVVMPLIPDDYWYRRSAKDGSIERLSSTFTWLMVARDRLTGRFDADALFDDAVRFNLVAQMLHIVAWLHARGVVFGDISMNNFVFALNPPRVMALDTDAVVTSPATASSTGRMTNFYVPPEMQTMPPQTTVDEQTDIWKAAALTLRTMTPGKGAMQRRADAVAMLGAAVPRAVVDLLRRALASDRAGRPPVAQLAKELRELVARLTCPPAATVLELVDRVVVRGETVRLRWAFDVVESIRVETPAGVCFDLDPAVHDAGFAFTADHDGLVAVHASNRHGSTTYAVGPLRVVDVPAVRVTVTGPWPARPPSVQAPDHLARRDVPGVAVPSATMTVAPSSRAHRGAGRGRVDGAQRDMGDRVSTLSAGAAAAGERLAALRRR